MSRLPLPIVLLLVFFCQQGLLADDATEAARVSQRQLVTVDVSIVELTEKTDPNDALEVEASQRLIARIRELQSQGKLSGVTRFKLTAMEGRQANLHIGQTVPVAQSRTPLARQPGVPGMAQGQSIQMMNTGAQITVVPRVELEGTIVLDLEIERTSLHQGTRGEASEEAEAPLGAELTKLKVETSIRVPNGQTVILQDMSSDANGKTMRAVVLVSATTDKPINVAAKKSPPDGDSLKIYNLKHSNAADMQRILQNAVTTQVSQYHNRYPDQLTDRTRRPREPDPHGSTDQ